MWSGEEKSARTHARTHTMTIFLIILIQNQIKKIWDEWNISSASETNVKILYLGLYRELYGNI
jgi:hypothetical protein